MKLNQRFTKFARSASSVIGSPIAFVALIASYIVWGFSGFILKFNDTWQLLANTTTTLITTLIVVLLQNTQNRDSRAIHLKLNEIILAIKSARNMTIALEEADDQEASALEKEFKQIKKDDPSCP